MPNYDPFYALKLAALAYASHDNTASSTKTLQLHFLGFWKEFYETSMEGAPTVGNNSLAWMFRTLLSGLGIGLSENPIYIISVFGEPSLYQHILPQIRVREPNAVFVGFSGEPHHLVWDGFHINLVMEPTDLARRIVCLPIFLTNAYEYGLWPYLSAPRPWYHLDAKRFCAFVVRNGGNPIRNTFASRLSAAIRRVDCAGPFMNNMPNGATAPDNHRVFGDQYYPFLQQYKFVICFENVSQPMNFTEKLLNAWLAGTIPIYWGCPNVLNWLNPKSFLYLSPSATMAEMDALIERVRTLDTNPNAYRAMFNEPLIDPVRGMPPEWTLDALRTQIRTVLTTSLRPSFSKE